MSPDGVGDFGSKRWVPRLGRDCFLVVLVPEFGEAGGVLRLPFLIFSIPEEVKRRSHREDLDCVIRSVGRPCESALVDFAEAVRVLLTFRPGACCIKCWSENGLAIFSSDGQLVILTARFVD